MTLEFEAAIKVLEEHIEF